MKKVVTILVSVFSMIVLTNCTDQSAKLEERIEFEHELQLVDPKNDGTIDPGSDDEY